MYVADLHPSVGAMVAVGAGTALWLGLGLGLVAAALGWWLTGRASASRVKDTS